MQSPGLGPGPSIAEAHAQAGTAPCGGRPAEAGFDLQAPSRLPAAARDLFALLDCGRAPRPAALLSACGPAAVCGPLPCNPPACLRPLGRPAAVMPRRRAAAGPPERTLRRAGRRPYRLATAARVAVEPCVKGLVCPLILSWYRWRGWSLPEGFWFTQLALGFEFAGS